MKKKWVAWLLALAMLFSLVPTALAAEVQPAQNGLVFWLDGQLNAGRKFDDKADVWTDLARGSNVSLTLGENCGWDADGKGLALKNGTYVRLPDVVTNAVKGSAFTAELVVSGFSFVKQESTPLLRAENDSYSFYIHSGNGLRSK